MDDSAPTTWDRIGWGAVLLLLVAFGFATLTPLVSIAAGGEQVTAVRDDDVPKLVAVQDDDDGDDDDDDDDTSKGTRTKSGSASIGSKSGNTQTGTTGGTGKSKSVSNSSGKSKDTKTGTTGGTGPSKSVSNSS